MEYVKPRVAYAAGTDGQLHEVPYKTTALTDYFSGFLQEIVYTAQMPNIMFRQHHGVMSKAKKEGHNKTGKDKWVDRIPKHNGKKNHR